ncbi:GntR family transcriptional regulator [Streptomyces sp. NBC_00280]|uniref:GntR family transcriptional regulator n=1 Tax=Streptomyces sp. NBC_00280 TaxID=2975699 RepID=UPI0032513E2B
MGHEDERQVADGGGREFERVSALLRQGMAGGVYPLGSLLPTQRRLAHDLGVSRDTVQRVLKELRDEGWIESRQGSGSRVVRIPSVQSPAGETVPSRQTVDLGPLISAAFERSAVALDVYTLTSESLATHIQLQLERIRARRIKPSRVTLRVLVPDDEVDLPYLRADNPEDTERLRERLRTLRQLHVESLLRALREMRAEKLVAQVDFAVRRLHIAPTERRYIINGVEVLYSFYVPIRRTVVLDNGNEIPALDVLGLGAPLTHFVKDADPGSRGSVFVEEARRSFDAMWEQLGVA